MSYRTRPPLTPPTELVGHLVTWRPRRPDGTRLPAVTQFCVGFDADARTLTIEREDLVWGKGYVKRQTSIPLSSGPFRRA